MITLMKLKRKDLDEVNDDFSDFSLSSPARKIRRLDAGLPPIFEEEEEAEIHLGYQRSGAFSNGGVGDELLEIGGLHFVPENEEKAIVPFNPMNGLLMHSPNQALLGAHLNVSRPSKEDELRGNGDDQEVNTCRAVIPWVPSQHLERRPEVVSFQPEVSELMDADEMEEATMEIEDVGAPNFGQQVSQYINHPIIIEGQHQWQQQHCMIPQPPQNVTTPIVWYR